MALALWDGPPEGEYRGYHLYYETVLMGCLSTLFLFVAWYKGSDTRMKRLAAWALLVCAGILLVAIVMYVRAADHVSPRAYVSLPLPLVLWVAAAALVLWKSRSDSIVGEDTPAGDDTATALQDSLLAPGAVDG